MSCASVVCSNDAVLSVCGEQPTVLSLGHLKFSMTSLWPTTQLDITQFQNWKLHLETRKQEIVSWRLCFPDYSKNHWDHLHIISKWVELENIILSKVAQTQKFLVLCRFSNVCSCACNTTLHWLSHHPGAWLALFFPQFCFLLFKSPPINSTLKLLNASFYTLAINILNNFNCSIFLLWFIFL